MAAASRCTGVPSQNGGPAGSRLMLRHGMRLTRSATGQRSKARSNRELVKETTPVNPAATTTPIRKHNPMRFATSSLAIAQWKTDRSNSAITSSATPLTRGGTRCCSIRARSWTRSTGIPSHPDSETDTRILHNTRPPRLPMVLASSPLGSERCGPLQRSGRLVSSDDKSLGSQTR